MTRSGLTAFLALLLITSACSGPGEGSEPEAEDAAADVGSELSDADVAEIVGPEESYRYILVDDLGSANTEEVLLDAIMLEKPDGTYWGQSVARFEYGGMDLEPDPSVVLGEPDAYDTWPDLTSCANAANALELNGGEVVVEMPVDIEVGDTLTLLVLDGCTNAEAKTIEGGEVLVWLSPDPNQSSPWWLNIATGRGRLQTEITGL